MVPKRQVRTVAVYARRSEADEKKGSVPGQLRRCKEFANGEGWTTREFSDDGISGWDTRVRRDGYEQMLAAIRAGEADAVIIDKADRLTRQDEERAEF
ncbi:MAG TPA: recombinase family protein, partial [Actinomycetota bacterium]